MNGLSSVLTAFCAACVLIGSLYMLCPDGAMSRTVKYALSLVFLISVIASAGLGIKTADFDFNIPEIPETDTAELETASARYVYSYALSSAGIDFSEITVCTDKTADNRIIITKVIIKSPCTKSEIIAALGEAAQNYEVEIINE